MKAEKIKERIEALLREFENSISGAETHSSYDEIIEEYKSKIFELFKQTK